MRSRKFQSQDALLPCVIRFLSPSSLSLPVLDDIPATRLDSAAFSIRSEMLTDMIRNADPTAWLMTEFSRKSVGSSVPDDRRRERWEEGESRYATSSGRSIDLGSRALPSGMLNRGVNLRNYRAATYTGKERERERRRRIHRAALGLRQTALDLAERGTRSDSTMAK